MLNTTDTLKEVLQALVTDKDKKNPIFASAVIAEERERDRGRDREERGSIEDTSLDDMPTDEEVARSMGSTEPSDDGGDLPPGDDFGGGEEDNSEGLDDLDQSGDDIDAPEETEEDHTPVSPYDLAFHLRKVSSAFTQVANEADKLKKLTESITSDMSSEQQAQWIEQRRFFIETSKEAEQKWIDFKKVLLDFSLTPKF